MTATDLSGTTAVVTGASRGFGRGIATALAQAGAHVVGVARDREKLAEVHAELGSAFTPIAGDAADPVLASKLLDDYRPRTLVLNAGATPVTRPIHHHTWETFSRSWDNDVRHVFNWTREAMLRPLAPGSVVLAMSSGASVNGSPLSGGYAGAKAAIRFIAGYAAEESARAELGIRFLALLPKLTPATEHGHHGVTAYAERLGVDVETFLEGFGPVLTIEQVAKTVLGMVTDPDLDKPAYMLSAQGFRPLG